jgi:osmotically-inducible protein OsmY
MRAEIIRRAKQGLLEDDELQLVITEQIEEDPSFWTGSGKNRTVINVEVNDGHVTLKGVVRSAVERRRADIMVRALGASGVDNQLKIADEAGPNDGKRRRVA